MKKISFLIIVLLLSWSSTLFAQKTAIYDEPGNTYRIALELFDNEKYSPAKDLFEEIEASVGITPAMAVSAQFYKAVCAARLFNDNAEDLLENFVSQNGEKSLASEAWFELARVQYNKRSYRNALSSFENVNFFGLKKDKVAEYYFKTGYCYLKTDDLRKAKAAFYEIKDGDNLYSGPANYYYAHINFEEGNYETALKSFTALLDDEDFGAIAPHYLIRIYFAQEKYDRVIELASELNPDAGDEKSKEILRLVGESYYHLGDYEEALPWLKKFITNPDRNAWYQLGFSYYKTGRYSEAIPCFEKVTNPNDDELAQNAFYHLGDCYVKTDQKKFAGTAFKAAYAIKGNQTLREDALFNYAKLSYELSYDPYNEAIEAMQEYLADYPDSPRKDEAYSYLVNLFLVTRNYDDALLSLEKIDDKNQQMKSAYQQITYSRAIELFKEARYEESVEFFNKSMLYNTDAEMSATALFWEAEAMFRMGDYTGALKKFKAFMVTPGTYSLELYPRATYNIAYCYFKQKDYASALTNFRKFTSSSRVDDQMLKADAYVRSGDCFFVNKRYEDAINAYNTAIDMNAYDKDYALYQKSISLGAIGNFAGKAWILKTLVKLPEKSPLRDDAIFELATTYIVMNETDNALQYFQMLYTDYPRSSYAITALQKTGLIYYNQNKNTEAIAVLKQVAEGYPQSPEAKEALASLRNIYVDMGRVDEYFNYAKNISYADISYAEQDSLTYIAVENKYMDGDCDFAVNGFRSYLEKYPEGAFIINANYYKADCEYRNNNIAAALENYEAVASAPRTRFTENALVKASAIRFAQEEYVNALAHYEDLLEVAEFPENILAAKVGLMRSNAAMGNYEPAIEASLNVLAEKTAGERLLTEAHMTIARAAYALDDFNNALAEYKIVVERDRGDLGAEAKYFVCLINFKSGDLDKAEEEVFSLIENFSSSDYWFARAFILLSDIYVEKDNLFQARQTLQSIIDNYNGEDLVLEAQEKLNVILEMEKEEIEALSGDSTEIQVPEPAESDTLTEEF
ncbi:MAG: hypothetical protein C0593_08295 [Marinilabiliales bacterium]|nr:MAG: hypothetical protein C0593_08295 [Marinilabiliales bacterium]